MARHAPDEVTDAINRAVDEIGDQKDDFVGEAARRVLEKSVFEKVERFARREDPRLQLTIVFTRPSPARRRLSLPGSACR